MNTYICSACKGEKVTRSVENKLQMLCCKGDSPVEHNKKVDSFKAGIIVPAKEIPKNEPVVLPAATK